MKCRQDEEELSIPLIAKGDADAARPAHVGYSLMILVWAILGGVSLVVGTGIFYFPNWRPGGTISAILFTFGSFVFFMLDTQGVIESRNENLSLRINMLCGCVGSFLSLVGSIGFFPQIFKVYHQASIGCFLAGTIFQGVSQLWKMLRMVSKKPKTSSAPGHRHGYSFLWGSLCNDRDFASMFVLELISTVAVLFFLIGMVMVLHVLKGGRLSIPFAVLDTFMAGSLLILAGCGVLVYRYRVGLM